MISDLLVGKHDDSKSLVDLPDGNIILSDTGVLQRLERGERDSARATCMSTTRTTQRTRIEKWHLRHGNGWCSGEIDGGLLTISIS